MAKVTWKAGDRFEFDHEVTNYGRMPGYGIVLDPDRNLAFIATYDPSKGEFKGHLRGSLCMSRGVIPEKARPWPSHVSYDCELLLKAAFTAFTGKENSVVRIYEMAVIELDHNN